MGEQLDCYSHTLIAATLTHSDCYSRILIAATLTHSDCCSRILTAAMIANALVAHSLVSHSHSHTPVYYDWFLSHAAASQPAAPATLHIRHPPASQSAKFFDVAAAGELDE